MSILTRLSRRTRPLLCASALALLGLAGACGIPALSSPAAAQQPQAAPATVQDEVRSVLTQYGQFVQHPRYGEIWVPSVTPPNWHPYPACHWVNTKQYGWYFDDQTPWGKIVHHYGRWTHDAQTGWFWVPGAEFSPGWVVWRTSPQWIGWAPTLPDEDVQSISKDDFNNGGFWTFMETAKFARNCSDEAIQPAQQTPTLLTQTQFVTNIQVVSGISIFVLPPYIVGPIIDISITFPPWPSWFFAQWLIDLNWVWNNLGVPPVVVWVDCPPMPAPVIQPAAAPPPPPPGPAGGPPPRPIAGGPPPAPLPVPVPLPSTCPFGSFRVGDRCVIADTCPPGKVHGPSGACVDRIVGRCDGLVGPALQRCLGGGGPLTHCEGLTGPALQRCLGEPTGGQTGPGGQTSGRCANLSGEAFRQCLTGVVGRIDPDTRPPVVRPPIDHPPIGLGGHTGPGAGPPVITHPVYQPGGGPTVQPNPVGRLPRIGGDAVRKNPNPVVLQAGGGGHNTFGGHATNAPARLSKPAITHPLPLKLPQGAASERPR
ncbi:MAG: hypothetical protein HXX10_18335 [Rhodoplanes sp.]|uniref:DUF6600 domain-containing protein n=1 Tax=Rhodoplanes sp. TaxID=1968906 RepID=UPI0017F53471|nr:DUF6600 domain-containing protein [Rhodoplanes sp.]NVO15996.1 hypothetical protein [Rhodoplanes sp.]